MPINRNSQNSIPSSSLTPILLEAEDLILDTGSNPYIISQTNQASNGALVFLPNSGDQGILQTNFTGESANYSLEVFYFDETDGESTFELKINDTNIQSWVADSQSGAPGAEGSRISILIEDLDLNHDDKIEIFTTRDGGEPARIDNLIFTPDDKETITGTDGKDTLKGTQADDIIIGLDGNDRLYGCNGNDELYGGGGRDKLYGGADNDVLYGGDGRDKLYGGAGDDIIIGGADNDTLYGGDGSDIFSFQDNANGDDRIKDFTLNGPEADKLDISDILTDFESGVDDINDFVEFIYKNNNRTDLFINEDGQGNDFIRVAVISGSDFGGINGIDAEDLLNNGQLII